VDDGLKALAQSSPAGLAYYDLLDPTTGKSTYELPRHIDLLNTEIRSLCRGDYEGDYRGIIFSVPPRHGKSFEVSHYTPPWFLGTWPEKTCAVASYEADFAASWGKRAREVLETRGPEVFGVEVDPSNRAANYWRVRRLRRGRPVYGSMLTTGIGGPLTGRGVNLMIVDDPVKNALEAHSKTKRNAVWEWWTSTAATRLEPGGVIVIIMTRWHEDDLAGRLIKEMNDGNGWRFKCINLPALAEQEDPLGRAPGEALWPERYPVENLESTKRALGSYVWNSLYQGRPAARAGGFFDPDWFEVVDEIEGGHVVKSMRRWDLAASEAEGDYTAGVKLERTSTGQWYVTDVVRGQWSPARQEEMVKATAMSDGRNVPIYFEQERGAAGKIVVAHYRRLLPGFNVRGKLVTGDKEVRAQPASAACEGRKVSVIRAPWNRDFLEELATFPHGTNDDQVDAFAGAFTEMASGGTVVSM
jgi:predicted phage terminase large subunit-like protein